MVNLIRTRGLVHHSLGASMRELVPSCLSGGRGRRPIWLGSRSSLCNIIFLLILEEFCIMHTNPTLFPVLLYPPSTLVRSPNSYPFEVKPWVLHSWHMLSCAPLEQSCCFCLKCKHVTSSLGDGFFHLTGTGDSVLCAWVALQSLLLSNIPLNGYIHVYLFSRSLLIWGDCECMCIAGTTLCVRRFLFTGAFFKIDFTCVFCPHVCVWVCALKCVQCP